MKSENKVLRILKNLDLYVSTISLVVLVILTTLGVLMRYVVGKPFTWLEEVQLFCMVWIVFGAAGVAFRTHNHVAIEIVVDTMPAKMQKVVEYLIDAIVLIVLGYLLIQSVGFVKLFLRSGRSTSMLGIPYWFIYGIAPLSCVDMLVSYFFTKYVSDKKVKEVA
jgi:TRAP-type C4-dicarboxylate transport system permease small subunit